MSRFFRTQNDSSSSSESSDEELLSSGEEAPAQPAQPKQPMSRFLKTAGDSDASSSSSSSDSDDSDDDDQPAPVAKPAVNRFLRKNAGLGGGSDSDDSDDAPKIVKSAKDKRIEEMQTIGKAIDNAVKIGDWNAASTEFEKLGRLVQRQTGVSEPVPPYWLRAIVSLETAMSATKEKDSKKKLNAAATKALNGLKQKVKKASKEHEELIKEYNKKKAEEKYIAALAPPPPPPKEPAPARSRVAEAAAPGEGPDFTTVGKGGKGVQHTQDTVLKDLAQVNENRGKKNTDRVEQVRTLERLLAVAEKTYLRIRVLLALISARFDYNPAATHMPIDAWMSAQEELDQLVRLLLKEPAYSVDEQVDVEYDDIIERNPKDHGDADGIVRIRGSVISFVDRLDEEFTRSLQNTDPHGTEYIERLRHEKILYKSICLAELYFERTSKEDPRARVIMRRLEHIYYKPDVLVEALEQVNADADSIPALSLRASGNPQSLVHSICILLYKTTNPVLRTRAMLCHIYNHALHNEFYTARDMLLMSHLQESVHSADIMTQILYNRTIVQLGLCAFRCGLIKECQAILQEIFATQRVKELLAQGLHQQRYTTLTPEQEKAERNRQMPFHMHINTELAEAVFLVASMLIEIPLLASLDTEEAKRKTVSKSFRRLLEHANRQVFNGPPENTRDHIMQASKALQDGEWQKARDLIQSIAIWNLMPEAKSVKEMLAKRIQEEGLRTYLFSNAPHYSTLSLELLSRIFSLSLRTVTSIVSKMIWNEELAASLDQASGVVVFHRTETTKLQQLALALSERVAQLVEQNEKTLDNKLGNSAAWADRGDGKGGEKRGGEVAGGGERRGTRTGTRGALRGGARGRGARFAQGLGGQVAGARAVRA
ncbi:related to translation initiation factor eIF3 [Serendipita indica DSM 11827]|uniref:Eukaryotic translation initiation factor 3 subunit C n=1 Tax=Serendipita indica (strain DSM 11827) TaxID=1109443 RepID=G4TB14_SERID|nr:related to translation initiation factor eIF3 [Serendipita indica DSM 11827]